MELIGLCFSGYLKRQKHVLQRRVHLQKYDELAKCPQWFDTLLVPLSKFTLHYASRKNEEEGLQMNRNTSAFNQ